jgi:hypothetical protein
MNFGDAIFWDVMPYNQVANSYFASLLHSTNLKMEAVYTPETSVNIPADTATHSRRQ